MAYMLNLKCGILSLREYYLNFYKILGLFFIISVMVEPSSTAFRDHRLLSKNVTKLLDNLLATDRYDKRIRPDFGGHPVKIFVNMYIKSIGPVSETDEWYSMDCYFRQRWYDGRLRFNLTGLDEFSMNWLFLERVWKPDTYFMNGKKSYLHRITVPNKFLRIRNDGFLTYSMRLTIKASCKMHLRKFPFDSQICPLLIGSYGYSARDVQYQWFGTSPVGLEEGVNLAQYDLVNITTEALATQEQIMVRREDFSVIKMNFHLKRHTGYFMLQVYVPCGLIVSCSWVSFWIDPDAVPARVSLGVTTVLSMTTMGFGGRSQLPKVSYRTALDWFVILCFSFVFAVMIEYAAINFIDTITTDIKKILEERRKAAAAAAQAAREKRFQEFLLPSCSSDVEDEGRDEEEAPLSGSIEERCEDSGGDEVNEEASLVKPALVSMTLATAMAVATMAGADVGADRTPGSASSSSSSSVDPDKWPSEEEEAGPPIPTIVIEAASSVIDLEEASFCDDVIPPQRSTTSRLLECAAAPVRRFKEIRFLPTEEEVALNEPKEKFSKIDRESRKIFPILFAIFIAAYWFLYIYYMTDEVVDDVTTVNKPSNS